MEQAPEPGTSDTLTELKTAAAGRAETAAERIRQSLSAVEGLSPDDAAGLETDSAVLTAVRQAGKPDPILELLPLESLAKLSDRFARRLADAGEDLPLDLRRLAWEVLDLVRRSSVLRRIPVEDHPAWSDRILDLVERSHLTVGPLFRMRAGTYGTKPLLNVPTATGTHLYTWRRVAARVETLARGLHALADDGGPPRVAILSENRVETALVDLACLTTGIVNVPIPANATEAHVGYILKHACIGAVVVAGRAQLDKVLGNRANLPDLQHVVVVDPEDRAGDDMLTLESLASRGTRVSPEELEKRSLATTIDDLATIMYTSGTTGTPKGIQFSQRNIVFKRFARGLALPEIGEDDVFLSYLPLFHTFGRFLELLGCVYWGATYCFLDNPSASALVEGMQRFRPTVFISVPKKWIQLYEAIVRQADPDKVGDDEVGEAVRRITGGRLRWGLSAAGHLDSEIFRFFQHFGTELMSGFGMTEATGGISMTPPGSYRDGSLGLPLPGIEAMFAEDGELLIRGPYVMIGYFNPPDGEESFDADGWLHSGDLMRRDSDEHIYLVDRKKEIYKNIKGETIAPQAIENLFRDFESVGRVFLVGDHREFNAALIYPSPEYAEKNLASFSAAEVKDHFRSVVVSVNKFLAPYERIVDFAIIDRDLDPDRGELTPKNTPRRKTVEKNFEEVVRLLYRRTNFRVGDVELIVPNWVFQGLGLTAQDVSVDGDRLVLRPKDASLVVQAVDDGFARIGSCLYSHPPGAVNLGDILAVPRLWLGNEALVDFIGIDLRSRERRGLAGAKLRWKGRAVPPSDIAAHRERLQRALNRQEPDLLDLHLAAQVLEVTEGTGVTSDALRLLEHVLTEEDGTLAEPARWVLGRAAASESLDVRRRAFQVLVPAEKIPRFQAMLRNFFARPGVLLDEETRGLLCERDLPDAKLEAFVEATAEICRTADWTADNSRRVASMLQFLAEYGAAHPTRYRRLRAFLVRMTVFNETEGVREEALKAAVSLRDGFRRWLGPTQRIAVDPETGHEYRPADVVAFEPGVDEDDRDRLLSAIRNTSFLREAVFLFSGTTVRLNDIPPGGVWIRLLGRCARRSSG
jgi:long-subunit acyl-CoA synthetase (AMP-forming)